MMHNEKRSFFYDHPNFYVETDKMSNTWLQDLKQYCARRFEKPVQIDVSILDTDTVKLAIMPAEIHRVICEDFKMSHDDGTRYIRTQGSEITTWVEKKDKERDRLIPFVQFRKGEVTKYPWHVLDDVGGMFIVEGRDPVQLMPLIASFKYKRRMVGNYYITTRKVPIGTAVMNIFIDYKDKHVPYERGGSYLRFDLPSFVERIEDDA